MSKKTNRNTKQDASNSDNRGPPFTTSPQMCWTKYDKEKVHPARCTRNRGNLLLGAKRKWKAEGENPQVNSTLTLRV